MNVFLVVLMVSGTSLILGLLLGFSYRSKKKSEAATEADNAKISVLEDQAAIKADDPASYQSLSLQGFGKEGAGLAIPLLDHQESNGMLSREDLTDDDYEEIWKRFAQGPEVDSDKPSWKRNRYRFPKYPSFSLLSGEEKQILREWQHPSAPRDIAIATGRSETEIKRIFWRLAQLLFLDDIGQGRWITNAYGIAHSFDNELSLEAFCILLESWDKRLYFDEMQVRLDQPCHLKLSNALRELSERGYVQSFGTLYELAALPVSETRERASFPMAVDSACP